MKSLLSQRYIFKIPSGCLRKSKWNLDITYEKARKEKYLVALASSPIIRHIDELNSNKYCENEVQSLKRQIKTLKNRKNNADNKRELKKTRQALDDKLFVEDYLCIIMENHKDYDRLCKGFTVNGKEYVRLLGTSGGIKKSTIIFTTKSHKEKLLAYLHNGRNMEKQFVPAKLEAYMSLVCSASYPVTMPKGVLVVRDVETSFIESAIVLDDSDNGLEPKMTYEDNYKLGLNVSDGMGLMTPSLAKRWNSELHEDYIPSGFTIRNAFCKGMVFTFDFHSFAKEVAVNNFVKDVWGEEHNIDDIELVLTESMLKLWDSYESISHYLECCEKHGHQFSITKNTPKKLDEVQNLNYQFIQPLHITDEDVRELCKPTIDEINEILHGDYNKALLYLKGTEVTEENISLGLEDYTSALSIEPALFQDPHIKSKIHHAIKTRIDLAKTGVIKVRGNFAIIGGDPYMLCESMWGMEPKGLLIKGEFYSKFWLDKKVEKVAFARAPMTSGNNLRIGKIVTNNNINKWFKYLDTVLILNGWDSTCDALNGADKDGDTFFSSDDPIFMKGIKETSVIACVQKGANKSIPTEDDFIKSNKASFGSEIGQITNYITSMFGVQAQHTVAGKEWEMLDYRIKCGQLLQQNSIDKAKGIVSKPMPKHWYSYKPNKIQEEDDVKTKELKEFNLDIMADKKPYFMNYIYPSHMKEYRDYIKRTNEQCLISFGCSIEELRSKEDKTQEEVNYIWYFDKLHPNLMSDCIMNKIAWMFEEEFNNKLKHLKSKSTFDYTILKSGYEYSQTTYQKVKEVYRDYVNAQKKMFSMGKKPISAQVAKEQREMFVHEFMVKVEEVCSNQVELCDIVLDLCYTHENSKQFAWDMCSEQIIKNLLNKNQNIVNYITRSSEGEILFNGEKFTAKQVRFEEEE